MIKFKAADALVGFFMLVGMACMWFLAVNLGGWSPFNQKFTLYSARFNNISGLKEGASIEIAGVKVGKVGDIKLDGAMARLELRVDPSIRLEDDSIASVRTRGLIGEKFVKLIHGGSEKYLAPGAELDETESVVDIEELIGKFIYNK